MRSLVPICRSDVAGEGADWDLIVIAIIGGDFAGELAFLVEGGQRFKMCRERIRASRRRGLKRRRRSGRNHQRFLIADDCAQIGIRRRLRRAVEPDASARQIHRRDDVIENGGRRNVRHRRNPGADQGGRGGKAFGAQQRFEQRVLVLAVPVLVGQHFCGCVRLITPNAKIDSHVARVHGDELIEGAHLVLGSLRVFGKFVGLGANRVTGFGPAQRQAAVPVAHFGPAMKGRPGNGGQLAPVAVFIGVFGRGRLVGFVAGALGSGYQLLNIPGVATETGLIVDGRLVVGAPNLNVLIRRDFKCEHFGKHHHRAWRGEMIGTPELAGCFSLVDDRVYLVLQRVAAGKGADGQVLLFEVAVKRGLAGYGCRQIHGIGNGRVDR